MNIEDVRDAVEAAGKRHYAAASAGDTAAIDELFCDDVVYSHSNAESDDKSGYMKRVAAGQYSGLTIDHTVDKAWLLGDDVAVVCGAQVSSGTISGGVMKDTKAKSLDVWCHRDGRWQLLAHHMTVVVDRAPWRDTSE